MKSYKIYLTRSNEAAQRIAKSFSVSDADIQRVGSGMVHEDNIRLFGSWQNRQLDKNTVSPKPAGLIFCQTIAKSTCV